MEYWYSGKCAYCGKEWKLVPFNELHGPDLTHSCSGQSSDQNTAGDGTDPQPPPPTTSQE